jgi:hypothetical protein
VEENIEELSNEEEKYEEQKEDKQSEENSNSDIKHEQRDSSIQPQQLHSKPKSNTG